MKANFSKYFGIYSTTNTLTSFAICIKFTNLTLISYFGEHFFDFKGIICQHLFDFKGIVREHFSDFNDIMRYCLSDLLDVPVLFIDLLLSLFILNCQL